MSQQVFDAYGSQMVIDDLDGQLVSESDKSAVFNTIDIDLRQSAIVSGKQNVVLAVLTPCDQTSGMCRVIKITAPTSVLLHLIQEALQEQLVSVLPNAKVPQTGTYDCETAGYVAFYQQVRTSTPIGEVDGLPLDAINFRELLDRPTGLFDAIKQISGGTGGYAIILPDNPAANGIKFFPADVPPGCGKMAVPTGVRWGLVTAVGVAVAGVLGLAYALHQKRKSNPSWDPSDYSAVSTKLASDLKVGDKVLEREGSLLTIASVSRQGNKVTVSFERGMWMVPVQPLTIGARKLVRVVE